MLSTMVNTTALSYSMEVTDYYGRQEEMNSIQTGK